MVADIDACAGVRALPTWSEELVAEVLEAEGYAVWRNVPVGTGQGSGGGRGGGRKEADVIAFRLHPKPEVIHAEVGVLWEGSARVAKVLENKFDAGRRRVILRLVGETVGPKVKLDYHARYYTPQRADNKQFREALEVIPKDLDVEIYHIEDLVQIALENLEEWAKKQTSLRVVKQGTYSSPSPSWPYLEMLAWMENAGLFVEEIDKLADRRYGSPRE